MLQLLIFSDAIEKVVMHNKYLAIINVLEIKPQINTDKLSVFICGSFFAEKEFLLSVVYS
ncbi:hypothetical protein CDG76_31335 [Nostoc sp. 'Peltigera membranacea cyanobiont' 210A]|nr:hypothetical protein CDG76_31335 [Nostoc sp. 'Peltigera membranacea cyanobiont' 210A]